MKSVNCCTKFGLLLWKNWLLQWAHKCQIILEIFLPAILILLLVFFRIAMGSANKMPSKQYPAQKINNLDLFRQHLSNENEASKGLKYTIAYTPTNALLDQIVKNAASSLNLEYESLASAEKVEKVVLEQKYFAGIEFNSDLSKVTNAKDIHKFEFTLRFPNTLRTSNDETLTKTWETNHLFPPMSSGPRNLNDDDGGIPVGYLREGFLPLQTALSIAYLQLVAGNQKPPDVEMQRYPYPEYKSDDSIETLRYVLSFLIVISFIYPSSVITKSVTLEKERQLKEVMKIMGLDNYLHWLAWFVKSFLMLAISMILVTLLLKIEWKENLAVLPLCDWSILLVFLLVYCIDVICFCFMLGSFFRKANTAAAMTSIIMFLTYLPYTMLDGKRQDLSQAEILASCLFINTALGFGLDEIVAYELTDDGMQWKNAFTPMSNSDGLTLGGIMMVMLACSVVYMLICLYVEQIFPGEFGVPRKWNFPFTKKFWCCVKAFALHKDTPPLEEFKEPKRDPNAFEAEPTDKPVGIKVLSLRKKFGNKTVVKGITMNMYEDEITVLLGHNGAGKSTTINMLTGMIRPTSGTAVINGSDIRTNLKGARMSLGICPQHNVLFDDMSVSNHLRFFSRLKGLKGKAVENEVKKYLRMINLTDKGEVASSKLSGGMQRKLSLCCALTGDTKVVLCDEPSSGLDPAARRQLWELLQSEKVGRTLLLTTHFMDEADVLGDRVAIMCDGELKCQGTSFFLKKKFGSGYSLICVKRENCNSKDVTALLSKYVPNIQPENEIGAELTYKLSDENSRSFEKMFGDLESNSERLNLSGYGVSITSMEEVFMKVGSANANDRQVSTTSTEGKKIDPENSAHVDLVKGRYLWCHQWEAMFLKKMLFTWRKIYLFVIMLLIAILFALVIAQPGSSNAKDLPLMTYSIDQYSDLVTVLNKKGQLTANSLEANIAEQYQNLASSYGSNHKLVVDNSNSFENYILELGKQGQTEVDSRYLIAATIGGGPIIAWLNNQPYHTAPLTVNLLYTAIARALFDKNAMIIVNNKPLPLSIEDQVEADDFDGMSIAMYTCLAMVFITPFFVFFVIKERVSRAKLLQLVGGVRVWTFWLTQLLWDWTIFTIIALVFVLVLACFQKKYFATFNELGRFFLLLLIFGFAALSFTYLMSLMFNETATGYLRLLFINLIFGFIVFVALALFGKLLKPDTLDILENIFCIFPHFALAIGVQKLYTNGNARDLCEDIPEANRCDMMSECCPIRDFFAWEDPGILRVLVYLIAWGLVFLLLVMILESSCFRRFTNWLVVVFTGVKPPPTKEQQDEDVKKENENIKNMSKNEIAEQNLVLNSVSKYYCRFLAVNQVSLCIKPAECFGLMGVNGAGKTSTFKMMTGDVPITFGKAFVKGKNISTKMNTICKDIGYCPQFDALLEDLTGREVLKIFCLIRGVRKSHIKQTSNDLAKSFGFTEHIDKPIRTYSGGNKRKLSAAIAMLGNPSVIYLDEPTTGIDPAARRQLWNIICSIRDSGKSIVLTTHSMEECEALCTRLAVMVKGEFKCIGSTQHLKNKFSKGLVLKIKVKADEPPNSKSSNTSMKKSSSESLSKNTDNVKKFIKVQFRQAVLQEEHQGLLTFYIPLASIKWSRVFGVMEQNRERLRIEDYSISQTTLEEIFLEFAK